MNKRQSLRLIPCAVAITLLLLACENEIAYHPDDIRPRFTLNGFIYADSLVNTLYLSMTGEIRVRDAGSSVVEIRVNNELKETLDAMEEEGSPLRTVEVTTRFRPGDAIRIDARTNDGLHHAWVEETVPHPVVIDRVDTVTVVVPPKLFYTGGRNLRVKVSFKDRPGEKNYYRLVLEQRHRIAGEHAGMPKVVESKSYSYWPWEDIALTDGRPATSEELDAELFERPENIYGIFNDTWFKDSEYTLNTQITTNIWPGYFIEDFNEQRHDMHLAVRLLSITEAEYYYLTTMNLIDSDVLEDYISDPVKIPSNVHGGNGFVGISSETGRIIPVIVNEKVNNTLYSK